MNISVVICTYTEKRWDTLVAGITSVQQQSMLPYEIIVVSDNNPALAARLQAQFTGITVAENHGTPGISTARNVGVAFASGDIVAFIDDDAIADKDWLSQLARRYEDQRVLGVGGKVLPEWTGERPRWFPEEFDWVVGCSYRGLPRKASPVRNFIGCNMSFRREVFSVVKGFHDELGRGAAHPVGCEETDLCIRVHKGVDVTILTTMPQHTLTPLPRETASEGMRIIRVNTWSHTSDLCIAPGVYSVIKKGNWDLVHCQGIHTLVPPLTMLAARKAHIPFLVTFHTGGHSSWLRNKVRSTQWQILRPLLASAPRLIGVSRFEADYFRHVLHLPPQRFTVIPNGATLPTVQRPLGETPDHTLIVSLGRLERYKGHQHIITALPKIREQRPDARLLILGAGSYASSLRKLAQKAGVAEHVEIRAIPAGDRQAMAETLIQASLVTLMSEYEAHPVAVMEALSLQRPVLGIHTAGQRELAEQGLIRTIPLNSPPEVVAAAALEQIERPLIPRHVVLPTWDECAEKLLAVYESVSPKSQAGRGQAIVL